jgi:hypothetical protein
VTISISGGGVTLFLTVGSTAKLNVAETGYNGPFFATSGTPSVATITPASTQSMASSSRRAQDSTGVFTVTGLAAGQTVLVVSDQLGHSGALYVSVTSASGGPTPTPTPTPTQTPTPTPTPAPNAVVLSSTTLSFTGTGATLAQSVSASQSGFSGSFVASGTSCAGLATISQTGPTAFSVAPVAAGVCSFTITGSNGQFATLGVTVTVTTVGGS